MIDVPAKLSAQVRVFATGNGHKTDPVDAHSVALAALHAPNLRRVQADPELIALAMLADRRDELGRSRTETVCGLHRLLLELIPGGSKTFLSARQAHTRIAPITPSDAAARVRLRLVTDRGSPLMDLHGIGPSSAARLLADTGDIHRFRDRDRFASWNGTAPLDTSSGDQQRHRLSHAGNRKINRVPHIMAIVQLRNHAPGRVYYDGRRAGGKSRWKRYARSNDSFRT